MMVTGRGSSSGASFRFVVDPKPAQISKDIARRINKPMAKKVGDLHKKIGKKPVEEVKTRSSKAGGGQVRIGRSVKASAARTDLTLLAGRGYPDFAGQEWGSKQYPQFRPHNPDGYVIGAMMSDRTFMGEMLEEYSDGLAELMQEVFNE